MRDNWLSHLLKLQEADRRRIDQINRGVKMSYHLKKIKKGDSR